MAAGKQQLQLLDFSDRVLNQRRRLNLTQSELRKKAGVQNQLVGVLENKERICKIASDLPTWKKNQRLSCLVGIAKICVMLGLEWREPVEELQALVPKEEK